MIRLPTEQEHEAIRTAFLTQKLDDHEYAKAMPSQSHAEYRELRSSIAEHGYDHGQPIVAWKVGRKWLVLDGRHRRKAAREVVGQLFMGETDAEVAKDCVGADDEREVDEVEPTWMVFEGSADEALDLVERRNLHGRRNFASPDAKALAAMALYDLRMRDGGRNASPLQSSDETPSDPPAEQASFALAHPDEAAKDKDKPKGRIRDQIAEEIAVPPRTVARARTFVQHARAELGDERAAELAEAIKTGQTKLSAAEKEIKASRTKRERAEARQHVLEENAQVELVDDRLTVLLLDVVDALRQLADESVDIVIGDSPYNLSHGGTTLVNGEITTTDKGVWDRFPSVREFGLWAKMWLTEIERVLKPGGQLWLSATRHAHPTIGVLLQGSSLHVESDVVWQKTNATPRVTPGLQDDHELLWWAWKAKRRFSSAPGQTTATWRGPTVPKSERRYGSHPCQKPGWLIDAMLDVVDATPNDVVVDLFAGSGTTSERALARGCRVIAIENDPQWGPVIEARAAALRPAKSPVPTGTDAEPDPVLVAYVLAAVDGGASTIAEITAAIRAELDAFDNDIDASQTVDAINAAFFAKLIVANGGPIRLTEKGEAKVAQLAEQLGGQPEAALEYATRSLAELTDAGVSAELERVAVAVAEHFGFLAIDVHPSKARAREDEQEAITDAFICGLDGDEAALAGEATQEWSMGHRVGASLAVHHPGRMLALGLGQAFAPTRHTTDKMRELWNAHAHEVGLDRFALADELDEEQTEERALAFAVGFLSRWCDRPLSSPWPSGSGWQSASQWIADAAVTAECVAVSESPTPTPKKKAAAKKKTGTKKGTKKGAKKVPIKAGSRANA